MLMPFGKYRGEPVEDLPVNYLQWLWRNIDLRESLKSEVRFALEDGKAPRPIDRARAMIALQGGKFITIEPILDFDIYVLCDWIIKTKPEFVNVGADSKKHNLPEPTQDKVLDLVDRLMRHGIEVRQKRNLERLMER